MDDRVLADSLVAKLGLSVGLPDLALSGDGTCSLEFDGRHLVNIGFDTRDAALVLFAKLPAVANDKLPVACRLMLEANHFGSGTGGGVFSLAKATALPMLSRRAAARLLDFPEFEKLVTDFVGLVELWTQVLTDLNEGREVAAPAEIDGAALRV